MTDAQAQQSIFGELLAGHTLERSFIHALRPNQHLVGEDFVVEVAVRFVLGEDVPNCDQQSTGNRNYGLVGMFDLGQALILSLPIGITANSSPGCLNQSPTQFSASFFGDGFFLLLLCPIMNPSPKASLTD